MRRVISALTVFVLTVSGLSLIASPAAAAPTTLGPRVTRVSGGTFTTTAGGVTRSYAMSEFRVRGHSSAAWPKKPYGVVFTSDQSPFGLPSGRAFRLLANYHDRSLLRNRVAFDLARQMNGLRWTPRSVFTELFVNGHYLGSYQLIEEIKIAPNRVNLAGANALIAEFDAFSGARDTDGMKTKPQDPENGTLRNALIANHVNPFLAFLRANDPRWLNLIDMPSYVDYYLVREFTKDKDADFYFSNFYYTDDAYNANSRMFMGPVWDFDRSAGNEASITSSTVAKPTGWWVRYHNTTAVDRATHLEESRRNWYNRLTARPDFRGQLCLRWRQKASVFQGVGYGGIDSAIGALGGPLVAANDRAVWGRSSVDRPRSRGKWKKEVKYLRKWYRKRFNWMNANIC